MREMKRVSFYLPFQPKTGMAVMNELGQEVGVVVEVAKTGESDEAGNTKFLIHADVRDDAVKAAFQVFEPPFMR